MSPPRLLARLAELLVRGSRRDEILGDLEENHALRARRRGRLPAAAWYALQVATVPAWLLADRLGRTLTETRREGMGGVAGDFGRDLGAAVRSVWKRPAFSAVVILTLGVALGAVTAMFSVVNLALFQALPYPDAERLVLGRTAWPGGGIGTTVSAPDYYDVREEVGAFESLSALTPFGFGATVTGPEGAERVATAWASADLFRTLGVRPALGRDFLPGEGEAGAPPVAMLAHGLWQRRYGGSPDVLGSAVTVDGSPRTVVGILPPGFRFVNDAGLWLPMTPDGPWTGARQFHNWLVVGRLAPGATLEGARAEVDAVMARLAEEHPDSNRDKGMVLTGLRDTLTEGLGSTFALLGVAVILLLLVAAGNVANLLLARGSARGTELAVRAALGAGRARLVRMLVTESLVLALGGGAVGTALAVAAQRTLVAGTPLVGIGIEAGALQPAVLLFGLAASAATVLLFGVGPALASTTARPGDRLRSGTRAPDGPGGHRFRAGLVVLQVALSVVILLGAGLLARSFFELRSVDPGLDPEGLLTAELGLPRGEDRGPAERRLFATRFLEEVGSLPGVRSAALASHVPFRDGGGNVAAWNPDRPPVDASEARLAYVRTVSAGYFGTLGIPLLSGRAPDASDVPEGPPVVTVSRSLAETLFPEGDVVGRTLAMDGGDSEALFEIVGVAGDVRLGGLAGEPPMTLYFPLSQRLPPSLRVLVRTSAPPGALVGPMRDALRRLDPEVPLSDPRTMEELLSGSVAFTRRVAAALGVFALVALFLAALGLYGVLAHRVALSRREIGVRVALGADPWTVVRMVVARGLGLVAVGIALGLVAAAGAAGLVEGLLFGVRAHDPVAVLGAVGCVGLIALLACFVPARRAGRIDPAVAFRSE